MQPASSDSPDRPSVPGERHLEGARRGDPAATEALVRELLPFVRSTVHRYAGPIPEVDDWTQEVLVTVLRHLASFRGDARLTTWVHRIAVRHVIRQGTARGEVVHLDFDLPAEATAARDLALSRLLDAIDDLPPALRTVFVLRYIEGHTAREIGEMLDHPRGTVATRLRSARLALQRTLRAWRRS